MPASTKVTVTGHRINREALKKDREVKRAGVRMALAFADALRDEVGVEVAARIGSGRWWVSRNPRYAKYRAWVKLKYGSDRARKRGGASRSVYDNQAEKKLEEQDMYDMGNVQHLMVQWIARKLRSDAIQTRGGRKGSRFVLTSVKAGSTSHIDVTSAIRLMENTVKRNRTMEPRADRTQIRLKNLADALGDNSLQALKQSRYGQKLYRMAELAAFNEIRDRNAEKGGSTTETTKSGRKVNRAGSYKWGVQTGQLRDAWNDAQRKTSWKGSTLRILVFPNQAGDRLANGMSLTAVLQRKITRAGGNARLLPAPTMRKVVRRAMAEAIADMQGEGFNVRLKSK